MKGVFVCLILFVCTQIYWLTSTVVLDKCEYECPSYALPSKLIVTAQLEYFVSCVYSGTSLSWIILD